MKELLSEQWLVIAVVVVIIGFALSKTTAVTKTKREMSIRAAYVAGCTENSELGEAECINKYNRSKTK